MLRIDRPNGNLNPLMVCCNGQWFLVKEDGQTKRLTMQAFERRFGKAITNAAMDLPFAWIDLDDDPRAEAAAAPESIPLPTTPAEHTARVVGFVMDRVFGKR